MGKPLSKYESIVVAEYERYKADCGMQIGDHKLICKVLDAQDRTLKEILAKDRKLTACSNLKFKKTLIDQVSLILAEDRIAFKRMLDDNIKQIFDRLDVTDNKILILQGTVEAMGKTVDCTQKEVEKLKRLNTWGAISIRIAISIGIAVFICWYLYTNYWHVK